MRLVSKPVTPVERVRISTFESHYVGCTRRFRPRRNYKKVRTIFLLKEGGGTRVKVWLIIAPLVHNVTLSLYLFVLSHKKHMNLTRHFSKHACSPLWNSQTFPFPVTTAISFHSLRSLCDHSPFRERDLGCPSAVET